MWFVLPRSCSRTSAPGVIKLSILVEQRTLFFTKIMHFHYMTYMATPLHQVNCLRDHEILVDPSVLCYHYYVENFSDLCPRGEMKISKEVHQFDSFYLGVGSDHEIYNFLFPYPLDATNQISSPQQFFYEEGVNGRRMMMDTKQPILFCYIIIM